VFIIEYYKTLFDALKPSSVSMIEDYVDDIPKLSEAENDILTTDFTKKKVFVAIYQIGT
jgi:hypothetical protein